MLTGMMVLTNTSGMAGDYGSSRVIVPAPMDARFAHLAWPKVIKADDGTLIVAYDAGRVHANGEGCPAVSLSGDGGKTFTPPKILMTFDKATPYLHSGNLAIGKAEDGAIVLMAMAHTYDERNSIFGWRSGDSGKTWRQVDTDKLGDSKTGSVFGHVFSVPGRGLAVCGHFRKPKGAGIWIAYSADQGKTWGDPRIITANDYVEPAFIYAGGRLIGLVRENSACAYHQYVSEDLGDTWQFQPKAIQGNSAAVHTSPFLLADPVQPCTFYALQSERAGDKKINRIFLWRAQGDSLPWQRLGLVASCPGVEDFSYPWMCQLKGREWFLVFYAGLVNGPSSIYGMTMTIPAIQARSGA